MADISTPTPLSRHLAAELLGTALLLAIVIGSGVMAERLAGGHVAVALLANTAATVGGLYVLIEVFGPLSGAHFNPAVSAVMAWRGTLPVSRLLPCIAAQLLGAVLGAWLAHGMFELPVLQWSTKVRGGTGQWLAEGVATAGLLLVILRAGPGRAGPVRWRGAGCGARPLAQRQSTTLNSTRRSTASFRSSLPMPTMFSLQPTPEVSMRRASAGLAASSCSRTAAARCAESVRL